MEAAGTDAVGGGGFLGGGSGEAGPLRGTRRHRD